MNLEYIMEGLRAYRVRNDRFDRLAGAVLTNQLAAKAVWVAISTALSASRGEKRV